jgi:hypothetical protein
LISHVYPKLTECCKKDQLDKQTNVDKSFRYELKTPENKLVNNIQIDNMFLECYELDSNSQPARFRLKYLDRLFTDMNQKTPEFNRLWANFESKLGNLIRDLVSFCREKELLTQTEYDRYFVSVTLLLLLIYNLIKRH